MNETTNLNYSTNNNGRLFELYMTEELNGEHDGRKGQPDVVANGQVYECKFYTRTVQRRKSTTSEYFPKGAPQAVYNYSNGCNVINSNVKKSIEAYCKTFDFLAVGVGESGEKPEEIQIIPAKDAVKWLLARTYAKGSEAIRFGFEADTTKAGGNDRRLATLTKNGFKGIA